MSTHFKDGYKFVEGHRFEPLIGIDFVSQSSPGRNPYRTILWADGTTSCNCRGWATHKRCRHCDEVHARAVSGLFGPAIRDIVRLADSRRADTSFEVFQEFVTRGAEAVRELENIIPQQEPKSKPKADEPVPFRRIRL